MALLITGDIMLKTIVNITTSIITTNNLFTWFINHKNDNYDIYKKKIISLDLQNKLYIISSLIKDIITKNYINTGDSIDVIIQNFIKNEITTTNYEDYTILSHDLKSDIFINISLPLKISLISTLEIINIINIELNIIHNKIKNHQNSYFSYIYTIKIDSEISNIYEHNDIFEKRIDLLLKIIRIYNK